MPLMVRCSLILAFPFTYTVAGNELALNFATPFPQDDFDEERDVTGDGV